MEVEVYMIDYSICPNAEMMKLYNYCKLKNVEFFWIDHHITAIQNIGIDTIPGLVDSSVCGAFNTWLFMMERFEKIEEAPKILKLVNDFDTWKRNSKFSWNSEILPIIYYLNSLGLELNDNNSSLVKFLKYAFENNDITNEQHIGTYIVNYVNSLYNDNLKKIYNLEWNGYNCLVLNTTLIGSAQFENHEDYKEADLLITWSYDGKYYYYGAYSSNNSIDVGEICETFFNGGGHKYCGGGQLKEFILK